MQRQSDAQLLRDYAAHGSEPAFAEIVARHTDLVYSAALRQTGSPELAREITQSVFTDLARKARALAGVLSADASLAGWLFRGTRFAGLKRLRDDHRRQTHERQFMEHFHSASESAPAWERVAPVLDEAMAELDDADHEAVLLRYFQNQDFHAVGRALGVSDDTAQKRVSRAVERLREFLAQRGVKSGASGLVVLISANGVLTAPAGLSTAIAATALAGTTILTAATATVGKAIAMTTAQKVLFAAALAAAIGTGIYEAREASTLRSQVQTLQQQQAPSNEQIKQLTSERDEAAKQLAALQSENERLNRSSAELLRLRSQVGALRQQTNELGQRSEGNLGLRQAARDETQTLSQTWELVRAKQLYISVWLQAFFAYALEHQGQCPETFQQAAAYLPESVREITQTSDQFEILYRGSLDAIKDQDVIVLRESKLWQHVGGKWGRFYGIANGYAQYCSSSDKTATGNFDNYEKQHIVQSPRQ